MPPYTPLPRKVPKTVKNKTLQVFSGAFYFIVRVEIQSSSLWWGTVFFHIIFNHFTHQPVDVVISCIRIGKKTLTGLEHPGNYTKAPSRP